MIGTGMMKDRQSGTSRNTLGRSRFSLELKEEFQGPRAKVLGLPESGFARKW